MDKKILVIDAKYIFNKKGSVDPKKIEKIKKFKELNKIQIGLIMFDNIIDIEALEEPEKITIKQFANVIGEMLEFEDEKLFNILNRKVLLQLFAESLEFGVGEEFVHPQTKQKIKNLKDLNGLVGNSALILDFVKKINHDDLSVVFDIINGTETYTELFMFTDEVERNSIEYPGNKIIRFIS